MRSLPLAALILVTVVSAASCSSNLDLPTARTTTAPTLGEMGPGEGAVRLVAWAGYVEDGSSDPDVDWVNPFQERTGCRVQVRYADSAEEMLGLMRREGSVAYDGISAPGDVAGELIAADEVHPVDPQLFPAFRQVLDPLRGENARHYIVDGRVYGVPALYGPNALLFASREVDPKPTSWDVVFEPDSPYAGEISMIDSPMAIADAAVYLAAHRPELGIEDPYALTPTQLDAAVALLKAQEPAVALYWSTFTEQVDAFSSGDVTVGAGWPIALGLLDLGRRPVEAVEPVEGMTGWADTWMVSASAPHPNCMLKWMSWTLRPQVQAQMALWYGAAPSNGRACPLLKQALGGLADLADTLRFGRCGDEAFLGSLALWRRPTVECGDGRGRACAGYPAWQLRWRSIRD
jgi:putative spermidine/putrescine transport system substrate-binding protein